MDLKSKCSFSYMKKLKCYNWANRPISHYFASNILLAKKCFVNLHRSFVLLLSHTYNWEQYNNKNAMFK